MIRIQLLLPCIALLLLASCNKQPQDSSGSADGVHSTVQGNADDAAAAGQPIKDSPGDSPVVPEVAESSPLLTAKYTSPDGSPMEASRFIGTPLVLNFWGEW
ncbi:MAG: hypothetical protein H7A35_05175 [Planctomycetales bacterium]|nr:hypothetical protein [bacterium]UNM09449.1 MAG: hypothetical protein H7A35_05175 [Planctomycetales bacterium]